MRHPWHLLTLNMTLASAWMLLTAVALIAGVRSGDNPTWYVASQLVVLLIGSLFLMVASKRMSLRLGKYAAGVLAGVALVVTIALAGFYSQGTPSGSGYAYYNGGSWDTWVENHSIKTALSSSISDPATFIATFFTDCDETRTYAPGSTCSGSLYIVGVAVAELALVSGIVAGNVLLVKASKRGGVT